MVLPHYSFSICLVLFLFLVGCGSQTDLTQTLEVQRSGVLGKRLQVMNDSDLIKDKPSNTLQIVPRDFPQWPRNYRVGTVQAGTRVVTCRVLRITELAGFMVLPFYYTRECVLGMILDGPHAGKEVLVSEPLMTFRENVLGPATNPSTLPNQKQGRSPF
jgi:hypothetical protein